MIGLFVEYLYVTVTSELVSFGGGHRLAVRAVFLPVDRGGAGC